jgi:hypothetical protein
VTHLLFLHSKQLPARKTLTFGHQWNLQLKSPNYQKFRLSKNSQVYYPIGVYKMLDELERIFCNKLQATHWA